MARRLVRAEYVPPEAAIDAPTSLNYIDESNPPAYNMIIPDTGDGAVEVGDEPVKRYNGAGTEYVGDPIDTIPPTQPLGGFVGDSALPPGTAAGYVQFKFRRSDGLGGYIDGAWSSASEGAYPAIPSATVLYSNDGSSDDGSIIPYAAGTTIAYVSGQIEITNVDPWSLARVYPDGDDIAVTIGHTYRLSWVRSGSVGLSCYGGHPGGSFNDLFVGPNGAGAQSVEFTATAMLFELFLGPDSGSVGATVILDDILLEDIT